MTRACSASPHYHKPSDTVNASGHSLPMMTKCIKANLAVFATLAGVVDQTSIARTKALQQNRAFTIANTGNTIKISPINTPLTGSIEITDLKGRIVYQTNIAQSNRHGVTLSSNTFVGGIYLVRLIDGNHSQIARFVINR